MRILLRLQPVHQKTLLPMNYQYPLSAAIYKILQTASREYAAFLHNKGYPSPGGKFFKLFTFSNLWSPGIKRHHNFFMLKKGVPCTLAISSPMLEDFVQNFILGLFQNQRLEIYGPDSVAVFDIAQVETCALPDFSGDVKFKCLSPISLSTKTDDRETAYYYRPEDDGLSDAVLNNLRQKYETIHKKSADHLSLKFLPDLEYIRRRENENKRVTRKITIKEGDENQQTEVIGFQIYFTLTGDRELMEIAWECGIGQRTALGFGMIDVVNN